MQESVKIDRHKFLGGSDLPVIMGISPFKTRWQLLQEKAQIVIPEEVDTVYTRYGNEMEEKIRDYINDEYYDMGIDLFTEGKHQAEGEVIGYRCHTDGENIDTILEIKTTSDIDGNMEIYKAQLCFYMIKTGKENGKLACYLRPDDLSTEFDRDRLYTYDFTLADFEIEGLVQKINNEVTAFVRDLKRLKENPELTEQDFLPYELIELSQKIVAFEQRLAEIKAEEKAIKVQKVKLFKAMEKVNVKSWDTPNGYKITRVDPLPQTTKEETGFDVDKFGEEHPRLYKKYLVTKTKKVSGRAGYVLITAPKKEE